MLKYIERLINYSVNIPPLVPMWRNKVMIPEKRKHVVKQTGCTIRALISARPKHNKTINL